MPDPYHAGNRQMQDLFDTRRLADRLADKAIKDTIDKNAKEFIESVDMFFLATADDQGRPNCSYKGGDPGFVRVVDDRTIAFPNYDGNGMYVSLGNLAANPHVGLLFVDFQNPRRLRLNGEASLDPNDPLLAEYPEAQAIVRVRVRQIFPNCPRYIHKFQLIERSRFVPRAGSDTPVPDWKKRPEYAEVLAARDPARRSS